MPGDASTGAVDLFRVRVSQQWASMDGSHPSSQPVPNEHFVSLDWFRTEVQAAWSFAEDWDAELAVPYDVKRVRARYELPDGTDYDNPVAGIHHRDETLEGLSDLRLVFSHRWSALLFEGDTLRVGAGFTIPTGHTEANPYERAALGIEHQHIQFGNGTVDPLARADYAIAFGRWSLAAGLSAHRPLYENRRDYVGAGLFEASIGARWSPLEAFTIELSYAALYQTRAYWDGDADENSGYVLQAAALAAVVRVSKTLSLSARALRPFWIETRGGGDSYETDWIVGVAAEVSFGR